MLPFFKEILEDSKIMKVGVATKECADRLLRNYGVQTLGALDIRYMAEVTKYQPASLNKMCSDYLNITFGNCFCKWESPTLTKYQTDYAAKCAHLAIELFEFFAAKWQTQKSSKEQSLSMERLIDEYCKKYFNQSFDYNSGNGKPSQNNKNVAGAYKKKAPAKPRRSTKKSTP